MTQDPDIAGQTAGSGTAPGGDGGAGYGSGQTGARITLGVLLAICLVGLVWVFWPEDRGPRLAPAETAQSEQDGRAGETPGTDEMSVAPGTDRVEENEMTPEAADVDPADAGEGAGVDPDLDATDEEEPRDGPEIDPSDRVEPVDPPEGR